MKATLITHTYISCPYCGDSGSMRVDHLYKHAKQYGTNTFGPWSCGECGQHINGRISCNEEGRFEVTIEKLPEQGTDVKCWTLLQYFVKGEQLFLIINDKDYNRGESQNRDPYENKEYYYNQHTCPINYLRKVEQIVNKDNIDPHGIFQYVDSVDQLPGVDYDEFTHDDWAQLFPQLKGNNNDQA